MKKKLLILLVSILIPSLYSQTIEYTVTQDCCSTTSHISLVARIEENFRYTIISKGDTLNINLNKITDLYGTSDTGYIEDDELISVMELNDSNIGFALYPLDYLKIKNKTSIPGISIDSSKKYKKESMLLYPSYYYDVLKANDLNTFYKYETYWNNGYYDNINNNRYESWSEIFSPNCIAITNSYVYFWKSDCDQDQYIHKFTGLIVDISKLKDNKYKIDLYTLPSEDFSNGADATFEALNSKQNHFLILEYDGDYVNLYLDSEKNKINTYVISSDKIESKLKQLAENKKTVISDIVWPRHADGTCDYEDSGKSSSAKIISTSTNVAVNKILYTNCNLKLRSGEASSTQVLTVMSAGTKVKILELGKEETIDNIKSNWVKVEIISGKDRDGKILKSGMTGWCYGGYLQ